MAKQLKRRRVLVVTGSRSEFGLLRPVMEAVKNRRGLSLLVAVAGEHLLAPALTWREVDKAFGIDAKVPMQKPGDKGRAAHAAACGRGVEGFAGVIRKLEPDWIVVLGDRIEAFAAASAASIAGVAVCHIHGGDRAEGIADEAMRHAITKLSHLHCAATELSAQRIVKMGEPARRVHVTGSPALDALRAVKPMTAAAHKALGEPRTVVLMHPSGLPAQDEERQAVAVRLAVEHSCVSPVLILAPNHDPGREIVSRVFAKPNWNWVYRDHLPRAQFLGLLKRLATVYPHGILVGNSSAGIIEASALGLPVVNVGRRQAGRERASNVRDPDPRWPNLGPRIGNSIASALQAAERAPSNLYGDGRAGPRVAALLAKVDPHDPALLRKRIAY